MRNKNAIMLAVAGAALVAASQAQAQPTSTYAAEDLLLNFRNPNAVTDNDLEVNAGPVQNLASGVVVQAALITSAFGTIGTGPGDVSIGFSANATAPQNTTDELWITREDSAADAAGNTAPTDIYGGNPAQSAGSTQNQVGVKISNIGAGYNAGTAVVGYNNAATVVGATSGDSYQAQAEQNVTGTGQQTINYALLSLATSKGGTIETIQDGSGGNVYEALWDIPATGNGSPVYDGYFTFQTDGEVDFTSATAAPEPSTYALLVSGGLGAWAMRRKKRA